MRLDDPHPENFVYFACRLREDEELCETAPNELIARYGFTPRGADVALGHFRKTIESRARVYRRAHEMDAQELGLDTGHPGAELLLDRCGSMAATMALQASRAAPRAERLRDGEWRPLRRTGTDVAFGAWLVSGAASYSAAADLLNDRRPRVERLNGAVDRNTVRRAVEGEIARLAFPHGPFRHHSLDLYRAVVFMNVHSIRTALVLWRKLHTQKGCNSIYQYWRALRRDGRLFELADELGQTVIIDDATFRAQAESLALTIQRRVLDYLIKLGRKRGVLEEPHQLVGATNTRAQ